MSLVSASLRLCGLVLIAYCLPLTAQTRDFTRHVNPFIGTGGHGHTFPGATLPFGMVQLSPDTRIDNWDGSSGYHYSDDIIFGFSHTHLSGTGIPDGCDILVTPIPGEPTFQLGEHEKGFAAKFSHSNEIAEPGYYSVKLNNGIRAELTATNRVGFHRYTFPTGGRSGLVFDLIWRDKTLGSEAKVIGNRIEGSRRSSSWAKNQTVYFVAEISKRDGLKENGYATGNGERSVKHSLSFLTKQGEQVLVKVAISFVSIEGARKNLEAELPGWDFDKIRADAKAAWNKELSKIEVSGGTPDQTTNFYTALYHTMIHPNVFNDVDGRYKGHDGKVHSLPTTTPSAETAATSPKQGVELKTTNPKPKIQNPKSGDHYTVFSLWDTFRAAHPLYTIIDQKRTVDFINTFIRIYEQGGRLPVWELWGEETDTMIGYHAVSVIADAIAKRIEGFDYEKAYLAAKHSANLDHHGLAAYKKRGFVSGEDDNESVSKTLEYAYNDWCMSFIARRMMARRSFELYSAGASDAEVRSDVKFRDYENTSKEHLRRSYNFENLFDPQTGFFRPKRNGGFISPFHPNEVTFHYTEANAWQYSFFVPHDVGRLITLMGGPEKFAAKLDELFTTNAKLSGREQPDITGLIGQYAHGNEPSHHIPYLYNYVGQRRKTQSRVRQIMEQFYKNAPDGLIGNEDCGQMSAWYVMSALGLYQVLPGSEYYDLGSPLFNHAVVKLENGKRITISAPLNSQKNIFVKSVRLDGKTWNSPVITHTDLNAGLTLHFDMAATPATEDNSFAIDLESYPFVPVPIIDGPRVFKDRSTVTLSSAKPDLRIFYTIDGSMPTAKSVRYDSPIPISSNTTFRAIAVNAKGDVSLTAEAAFQKRQNDWTVKLISEFNSQYPGSSYDAIIDGLRGNANFAAGEWQGYWGRPFEAVIDLQRETEIREVGGSFLQSARSWIWMPDRIEFETSTDGVNFTRVAEIKPGFLQQEMNPAMKEFRQSITPIKTRYVRVKAFNFGKIPAWHLGAGGDPWIFVDEIFIG